MDIDIIEAMTDADLERLLAVRNAVDPRPLTVAGLRAERSAAIELRDVLALVDGQVVGAGGIGWGAAGQEAHRALIDLWVLPDARGRGVGTRVFDDLTAFARQRGAIRLSGNALAGDEPSLLFAQHRGLHAEGSGQLGYLELGDLPDVEPASPPPGVTITTFAERPDLERVIYEIDILVRPEIPALADEQIPSFEAWQRMTGGDPGFLAALSPIAVEDGRVIGAMEIFDNAEGTIFIGMTIVHPDARRRGIARLMKTELTRLAQEAGMRRIETFNDGSNDRIRGLNIELGYLYQPAYVILKGPLPAESAVARNGG